MQSVPEASRFILVSIVDTELLNYLDQHTLLLSRVNNIKTGRDKVDMSGESQEPAGKLCSNYLDRLMRHSELSGDSTIYRHYHDHHKRLLFINIATQTSEIF